MARFVLTFISILSIFLTLSACKIGGSSSSGGSTGGGGGDNNNDTPPNNDPELVTVNYDLTFFYANNGSFSAWYVYDTLEQQLLTLDDTLVRGGSEILDYYQNGRYLYLNVKDLANTYQVFKLDLHTHTMEQLNWNASGASTLRSPVKIGDYIYFGGDVGDGRGQELYKMNLNTEQVTLVYDIYSGASPSYASNLILVGDSIYFTANDGTHGTELWKHDLNLGTTAMVADRNPTANGGGAGVGGFKLHDDGFIYGTFADNSDFVFHIYKFNPTNDTFTQLTTHETSNSLYPIIDNKIFHRGIGASGTEPYFVDLTDNSITLLDDVYVGVGSSFPNFPFDEPIGDLVIYSAKPTGETSWYLHSYNLSNGTNTLITYSGDKMTTGVGVISNLFYMIGSTAAGGGELFSLNSSGTVTPLPEGLAGAASSIYKAFVTGNFLFVGFETDTNVGKEPFIYNPSNNTFTGLGDLNSGASDSQPQGALRINGSYQIQAE
ncbi:MAG: hypothetical protein KDD40_05985 [Bdellovibrionales bacterium]|nr:hypothetical protein [Bdellovibrionales bacterium]